MSFKLAPSILSADFGDLTSAFELINNTEADWFHVDVMDGVFVPNITFGFPVMKVLQKKAQKPVDVHLMIIKPERYIEQFAKVGANHFTVHIEASTHLHRTIQSIKENGMKAGVAINPHTPVRSLSEIIADIDLVCLMSVNPGFSGQKFIPNSIHKIIELRELIDQKNAKALIECDGGVNLNNAREIIDAGADALVAGNAVFGSDDPRKAIADFKRLEK